MLFIVKGKLNSTLLDSSTKSLKQRRSGAEVQPIFELVVPCSYEFIGAYESRDITSLYKYFRKMEEISVNEIKPALHLDNILILEEAIRKRAQSGRI